MKTPYFEPEWNDELSAFNSLSYYGQLDIMGIFDDSKIRDKSIELQDTFKAVHYRGIFGMGNVARDGFGAGTYMAIAESIKPYDNPISVNFENEVSESLKNAIGVFFKRNAVQETEVLLKGALDSYATFVSYFPKMRSNVLSAIFEGYVIGHMYARKEFLLTDFQ